MDYTVADFSIFADAYYARLLPWANLSGQPLVLTGTTFELEVFDEEGGTVVHTFTTANGGIVLTDLANGKITFVYTPGDLAPGTYFYRLNQIQTGNPIVWMYGSMVIREGSA